MNNIDAGVFPFLMIFGYFYYPFKDTGATLSLTKLIFGIESPGVGMTRAICSVARFQFAEAWHYNPLVFIVIPIFASITIQRMVLVFKQSST